MWRNGIFSILIYTLNIQLVQGQCPVTDFIIPDTVCINETIPFINKSINGSSYKWNLCEDQLLSENSSSQLSNGNPLRTCYAFDLFHENDKFNLISLRTNGFLHKIHLNNSLNNINSVYDYPDERGYFSSPRDLKILSSQGNLIGLVTNSGARSITRINFRNSLDNNPEYDMMNDMIPITSTNGLDIIEENGNFYAFIGKNSSNQIYVLSFQDNLLNTPEVSIFNVPNATGIQGISLIKECGIWSGIISSTSNNKLFRLIFSNGLINGPDITEIPVNEPTFLSPVKVKIIVENGHFYAFIQSDAGDIFRFEFGSTLTNDPGVSIIPAITSFAFAIQMIQSKDQWHLFATDYVLASQGLYHLTFNNTCTLDNALSTEFEPQNFAISAPGTYPVSLTVSDDYGNFSNLTKEIVVADEEAPFLNGSTNGNSCIDNFSSFIGESPNNITSWNWDFGDSTSASIQNPSHQYINPGIYQVKLSAKAENGCSNFIIKDVSIYNPPIPYFDITDTLLCTNNTVRLDNSSTYSSPDSITSFIWNINNEAIVNSKDTSYIFTSPGNKNISLTASIPGCSSDTSIVISVLEGPLSSFSLENVCEMELVEFINESAGNIISYSWNFGDSTTSDLESPSHLYDSADVYPVSLSVTNDVGCINIVSKEVVVHAIPKADFSNELACHLVDVQFNDITTVQSANITKWNWHYKFLLDESIQGSDTIKNPLLNFTDYGDYYVSLETESNYGCIDSISYTINVLPSPEANFSNTISCLGDSTSFSDISTIDGGYIIQDWIWEFDQKMYYTANPSHLFNSPGEYQAMLVVRADNLCEGRIIKMIFINPLPQADFVNFNNCLNETILLKSTALSNEDPVSLYHWEIDNGDQLSGYQVGIRFDTARDYLVKHIVTTNLGCSDSTSKIIPINSPPTAIFNSSPDFGAPPLEVQFESKSVGAKNIIWYFNDGTGSVSNEINPVFTYTDIGKYTPALVAYNDKGCKDSITAEINIVEPIMDISLNNITEVAINDKRKYILNISNLGTKLIDDMEIIININGQYVITEDFQEEIIANESINYTLNFELQDVPGQDLQFLCIELMPRSTAYEDKNPLDNQECLTTNKELVILDPYPNPVSDDLYVNLLLPEEEDLTIRMISSSGKVQWDRQITNTKKGLNKIIIQMDVVPSGVYILNIVYKESLINRQVVVNN